MGCWMRNQRKWLHFGYTPGNIRRSHRTKKSISHFYLELYFKPPGRLELPTCALRMRRSTN